MRMMGIKKSTIIWLMTTAAFMLGLPWGTTQLPSEFGFPAAIFLFLSINPVYSLILGIFTGFAPKDRWWLLLAEAGLYLSGAWIFIAPLEPAFLQYAFLYTAAGAIAMGFTAAIRKSWAKRQGRGERRY